MARVSSYKGSKQTAQKVCEEIEKRFGVDAAKQYDPYSNCMSYKGWQENGYVVRRGEKSIRSLTFVEKKDQDGNVVKKYPKVCHLFFISQVEAIKS